MLTPGFSPAAIPQRYWLFFPSIKEQPSPLPGGHSGSRMIKCSATYTLCGSGQIPPPPWARCLTCKVGRMPFTSRGVVWIQGGGDCECSRESARLNKRAQLNVSTFFPSEQNNNSCHLLSTWCVPGTYAACWLVLGTSEQCDERSTENSLCRWGKWGLGIWFWSLHWKWKSQNWKSHECDLGMDHLKRCAKQSASSQGGLV